MGARCTPSSLSNKMMRVLVLLIWTAGAAAVPPVLRGGSSGATQRHALEEYMDLPPEGRGDHHRSRFLPSSTDENDDESGSVADPNGGSFEYLGCFLDMHDDRILGSKTVSADMTPMACHTHCDEMGAAYMGLQYGMECWCTMEGALDYDRHGTGTCDIPCSGDEELSCGGEYSFDMYKLEWPEPSDDEEYIGCYVDSKDERIMDNVMTDDSMTPELCRDHCENTYSIFYGLQYGNECWCGRSSWLYDYDMYGTGVCHMECAGDSEVACGGYSTFSLFRFFSDPVDDDDRPDNDDYTPSPVMWTADDDFDDTAPPSAVTTENQAGAASLPAGQGTGQYNSFADLLDLHNQIRCVHGSDALSWNEDIAYEAEEFVEFLTTDDNCGLAFHSENTAFGENIFLCGLSSGYGCYNADLAMEQFYDNEVTDSVDTYGTHATQVIWAETDQLGCALGQCEGNYFYEVLVCNYSPRGNIPTEREDNLNPPVRSRGSCGLP